MTAPVKLSVVVAVQHAEANLADILEAIQPDRHPETEFLFCYTNTDPGVASAISGFTNTVAHEAGAGSLIPHLWAQGIRLAKGDSVAITTAHVIPDRDWVENLLRLDTGEYPGIGGPISNDPGSSYRDWAIYFLRYIAFSPPAKETVVTEIAADNAVYRRTELLNYPDLLDIGFWEPSFHAMFRKNGKCLLLTPDLHVTHHNRYSGGQFLVQRYKHGRAFGLARAVQLSILKRRLLILLSPLLPFVFLSKIVSAVLRRGQYGRYLPGALPWLIFFLSGWGFGEARGYLDSLQKQNSRVKRNSRAGGNTE